MICTDTYASPLGEITLAADGQALTGLWFVGQKYYANIPKNGRNDHADVENRPLASHPILRQTAGWLDIYFSGREPDFMPPVFLNGSPFQMAVWEILKTIPYGQTMTYKEIAARIALQRGISRMSAQAVGGAVGHNPISIIVPCHRVVGADGSLTGYAGGIDKKRELLKIESSGQKSHA
ncbi:MAG: methylated-DNA--[protein]-cysteine S-methyltransferase [Lachnospiraceae bacterium]|nr:methylated-DNA--[protein]-cysteine S-methyltransferase [Lachnospiraceae bacterium]